MGNRHYPDKSIASAKEAARRAIGRDIGSTIVKEALEERNWMRDFPPPGVEVESWYIMMGVGQVVTLRVPPDKVREVNRLIEEKAWGAFRTEFYLTYDYKAAAKAAHDKALQAK